MEQRKEETYNIDHQEDIRRDTDIEEESQIHSRGLLQRQQPPYKKYINNNDKNSQKDRKEREPSSNKNNQNSNNRNERKSSIKKRLQKKVQQQVKQKVKQKLKKQTKKVVKKAAKEAIKKILKKVLKKLLLIIVKFLATISLPAWGIIALCILIIVVFSMVSSMMFSSAPADKIEGLSEQDRDTKAFVKQLSDSSFGSADQWMYRLPEELLSSIIQLDSYKDGKELKDFDPNNISIGGSIMTGGGSGASAEDTGSYATALAGQWMTFEATGYYGANDTMQGGFCPAVTCEAIGFNFSEAIRYKGYRIVAIDPRVIPLWSIVEINVPSTGLHIQGIALDTGGAIKGNRIDILHENKSAAFSFGRRYDAQIRVLRRGKGDNMYPQKGDKSPLIVNEPEETKVNNETSKPNDADTKKADQIIEEAKKYLGIPYVWGGSSPKGFDCSGLTSYVYKKFGIGLNRTAAEQSNQGRKITNPSELRKGDLLFFQNTGNRKGITHVAIYIGNGKMIEAPDVGQNVKISEFKAGKSFAWGTRVLGNADLSSNEGTDVSGGGANGNSKGTQNIDKALLQYFTDKLKPDFTYDTFTEVIKTKTKTCSKTKENSKECEKWESKVSESTREVKLITKVRSWNGNGEVKYKKVASGWKKTSDNTEVEEMNYLQDKQDFKYDFSKLDEILSNAGYQYKDKKMFELYYEYASGLPLHYIDWLDGKDISGLMDNDFIGEVIPGAGIPKEFMPIYLAAEKKYGTPWYILAAVHYHESSFSQNTGPSNVGARGPMQFMPATWIGWKYPGRNSVGNIPGISDKDLADPKLIKKYGGYGIDANGDGKADIMDNHDAIHTAAKYLSELEIKSKPQKALSKYGNSDDYAKKVYETAMKFKSEATYKQNQNQVPVPTSGDWMVPTQGKLSSGFGARSFDNHKGIDIAKPGQVPIVAAADGVVFRSYLSTTYGNCVMIRHNINGVQYETVYAHMRNRNVSEGTQVKKGQLLGYQGETGQAYGQHLHFEMHSPSWNINKSHVLNPLNFIKVQ